MRAHPSGEFEPTRRAVLRAAVSGALLLAAGLVEACSPPGPSGQPATVPPAKPAPTTPTGPGAGPASAPTQAAIAPVSATQVAAGPASAPTQAAVAPTAGARPTAGAATVPLPTRVPLQTIKMDLPASADGLIDPGLQNYPSTLVRSVPETGSGGDVTVATWTTGAAPTPLESNALWQAVNQKLGVTLRINVQAQADYATLKLPTLIAGGDLPDILYIATNSVIPQYPLFLQTKMADLTPYLSGDAVKDYPNLANFPTLAWKQVIFNNAIYGVPVPYPLYLWVHWVHQNLLDADGLARPTTADDYKQLALHFTQPDHNLYGLGCENNVGMGTTNGWLTGIFGAPNVWAFDDQTGKVTSTFETDQFKAAVGYARDLWSSGAYHPNALQYNLVSARGDFAARRFVFRFDGFQAAAQQFWDAAPSLDPPGQPRVMTPLPPSGGKPTYWANSGILGYSVIKQAPPERIKEILRILNWLASPIGSEEYQLMTYGLQDTHWTPDAKGNPQLNARGKADALVPFRYITQGPVALYNPHDPQFASAMQDAEKAMFPFVSTNAADGFYSPTSASAYPGLMQALAGTINDIVLARQPLDALDAAVKTFRAGGGDQMRGEFEQAIAAGR